VQGGTVSLSTAPEPGSKCEAKIIDADAAMLPNRWGELGVFGGTLYEWQAPDGRVVYTTRRMPGALAYLKFTVETPAASPAHAGLPQVHGGNAGGVARARWPTWRGYAPCTNAFGARWVWIR
jgi:hypothetical protein